MSGFEQGASIVSQVGEVLTIISQYFRGCVLGVVLGVLLVHLARKINANASWLVIPPAVSVVVLPSMHASRVLLTAGTIATLIAVPFFGLKGPFGDFGIGDAMEYRKVRIGASLLAGFLLLQVISVVVLIVSAVILVCLVRAWWGHGLSSFVRGCLRQDSE